MVAEGKRFSSSRAWWAARPLAAVSSFAVVGRGDASRAAAPDATKATLARLHEESPGTAGRFYAGSREKCDPKRGSLSERWITHPTRSRSRAGIGRPIRFLSAVSRVYAGSGSRSRSDTTLIARGRCRELFSIVMELGPVLPFGLSGLLATLLTVMPK